jgi:hypothetical protein
MIGTCSIHGRNEKYFQHVSWKTSGKEKTCLELGSIVCPYELDDKSSGSIKAEYFSIN